MAWTAVHRMARISPTKVRRILNLIRGKRIQEAEAILAMLTHRGAVFVKAVLNSAVANADNIDEVDPRTLKVTDARVDQGPTIKRWQPKDRGRAHQILKRTSHITVTVA